MLQGEHSAILSTFIMLPFVINIFVLSIFEWPLKTGFTVRCNFCKHFLRICACKCYCIKLPIYCDHNVLYRIACIRILSVLQPYHPRPTFNPYYNLATPLGGDAVVTKGCCMSPQSANRNKSCLLKRLRSLYDKQLGPRSDCSYRSSLICVHPVCFCTKISQ